MRKLKIYMNRRWKRLKILCRIIFKKTEANKDHIVVIDLKASDIFGRYLVNTILFFILNNYSVILRLRKNLIRQFGYYFRLIIPDRNVKLKLGRPDEYTFYLTNAPVKEGDVYLKPDLFGEKDYGRQYYRMPPPMHPLVYEKGNYMELLQLKEELRTKRKLFKMVFAGNLQEQKYKSFQWAGEDYLSRVELVETIMKEFGDGVFVPKSFDEFKEGSNADICIVNRNLFSLDIPEYFRFYASGYFAFCPPGIRKPYCHNLPESMFAGCVPVLQYGHLLSPTLESGDNSLEYSSRKSLVQQIHHILKMERNEMESLASRSAEYYDSRLSPDAVTGHVEEALRAGVKTVYIPAGI